MMRRGARAALSSPRNLAAGIARAIGVTALLCLPVSVQAAERETAAAVLELGAAASDTVGDGGRIRTALDRLSAAVSAWDASISAMEEAVRRAPAGDVQPHVALISAYLARGRFADALDTVEAALLMAPDDPELYKGRGRALRALGREAEGEHAFRRAWDLHARDAATAYYAFTAAAPDGGKVASTMYERCLRDAAPAADFGPGGLLGHTSIDAPVLPFSIYAPAFARLEAYAFEEGLAEVRRAAAIDPMMTDPAARLEELREGAAALRRGALADAHGLLERARAMVPESSEVHRLLGLTFLAAGQHARSREHLGTAIRLNPSNERARIAMTRALVDGGAFADAERILLETLERLPDSRIAQWWLGWVYENTNQLDEARAYLVRAAGPGTIGGRHLVWSAVGRLARVQGDFDGSRTALERAVSAHAHHPQARKELAVAYLEQDRLDGAIRELVAGCALAPRDADIHALAGRVHLDSGRPDAAVHALRRALELSPDDVAARHALANALAQTGHRDEAARQRAIFEGASRAALDARRRQMALDVLVEEAAVRTAEGFHDRAVALWQQVIAAEPADVAHLLNLAAAQVRAGRVPEAIRTYEQAAESAGPDVYRRLAELYAQVGRTDDSLRAMQLYEKSRNGPSGSGGGR